MYPQTISFKVFTLKYDRDVTFQIQWLRLAAKGKFFKAPEIRPGETHEYDIYNYEFESDYEYLKPGIVFQKIESIMWPDGKPEEIKSYVNTHPPFGWYAFMEVHWIDTSITYYKKHTSGKRNNITGRTYKPSN